MKDLVTRQDIADSLASFATKPLAKATCLLLDTLGYRSERSLNGPDSSPKSFLELFSASNPERVFDQDRGLVAEWKTVDFLFQLTDQELSRESSLFTDTSVKAGLLKSYVFIAIELNGSDYARGKFSAIVRQINRVFPMPVMVFFKHQRCLTIAVINRRLNKLDESKDVLGKVTLIREIDFAKPHPGHLEILASLALPNLVHPQKKPITDFDTLHAAWEQIFNIELLNERFYRELANWYFWALPQVEFPADLEPDDEKRRATGLIRLLTRLIFCWFLKEKDLIPEKLFHPTDLTKILKGFDPESETSSTYYQAILQNLFFATLNQRMGKDSKGQSYRVFAKDEGFPKNRSTYDVNNLYRYEAFFQESPEAALAHFSDIPFLNGGLFECLDRTEEKSEKKLYLDGFSRNAKKRPVVPDRLFFDSGETADLSSVYDDKKRKAEKVTGLIRILNRYKFTIVENTPIDQEIALDPELLGKVFENLLASYNEETKTTARKQTGSFYTPRPIVDYMVDESLKAHLTRFLVEKAAMKESDAKAGLDLLFAYTEKEHPFSASEVACLIAAIDALKILDPACGSGAFPMGVLHKLVFILGKLDHDNEQWKQTQLAKLDSAPMREELERAFADNNDDYGRKLYLIENCLYGVDIQPIAIQITKLRFFISLVCDQKTNHNKKENHGIRPLPNLETKFVAADTLIGLPIPEPDLFIKSLIEPIEKEIEQAYHSHFAIQRRDQKLALQKRIKNLRLKLSDAIVNGLGARKNADITQKAQHVAEWDAFDPQATADFFDPHWMFGRSVGGGFDIVVGNPPFLFISNLDRSVRENYARRYDTAEYRFDLYGFFIERAIRDLIPVGGLLTYIIPHTLLSNDSFAKLRRFLLTECSILQVIDIGPSVFSGASNETMTFLVSKGAPEKNHTVWVRNTNASEFPQGEPEFRIPQDKWLDNPKFSWPVRISGVRYELIDMLTRGSTPLGSLCTINQGLRTGDNSQYIRSSREGAKWKPVVGGKDIGLYEPIVPNEYVLYDPAILDAPRKEEIFTSKEKIIVQEIRNISLPRRIVATFDGSQTYALQSTNVVNRRSAAPSAFSLKYILAIINSSVINHFFRQSFPGNNHIASNQLASIPIHNPSQVESEVCDRLVSLILFAKDAGEDSPAAFLEDLIDACVMECYFRDHMAERDLLFLDILAPHLADYDPKAGETKQREFLTNLYQILNAPSHPVRNRLLRLTADSPDLLAIIKQEGKV
jgi:type I restriction-modification system DNA methylase subunit